MRQCFALLFCFVAVRGTGSTRPTLLGLCLLSFFVTCFLLCCSLTTHLNSKQVGFVVYHASLISLRIQRAVSEASFKRQYIAHNQVVSIFGLLRISWLLCIIYGSCV